jgi:hypothetical protein
LSSPTSITFVCSIPTSDEFRAKYRSFGELAGTAAADITALVFQPTSLIRILGLIESTGDAAATALVEPFLRLRPTPTDREKQLLGALTCALLEANGWEKTGTKRAIPNPAFNRGEVYVPGAGALRLLPDILASDVAG